jgi:hypothetical protein
VTPEAIAADRPGIADGSRVIAAARLQIEMGFQREFHDGVRTSFLPTLVRAGLGRGLEARVETNAFAWTRTSGPAAPHDTSGWSPTSFGFKYQIPLGALPHTLGTIVRVFPASGSGELRTSRTTGDVRLAADLELLPRFSLNPNVGVARYEDEDGKAFTAVLVAATVSYASSDRLSPFADLAYQHRTEAGGEASLTLDGGVAYILRPHIQADFSVGVAAHGPGPQPFVSIGLSLRSPR